MAAGGLFDGVGVGVAFNELKQRLVLLDGFLRTAGDEAERRGADRREPVPAPVHEVQDVRIGTVFKEHAVEILVQRREADRIEMLQAVAHLRVHRTGPRDRHGIDQAVRTTPSPLPR